MGGRLMAENDALQDLRSHPVFSIADALSRFTGIGRSLITLTEYLSLCAGKKGTPVNIDLFTDQFVSVAERSEGRFCRG